MILALMRPLIRTPSEGAVAVVWVATPPELANVSGKLFGSFVRDPRREFSLPASTRDPDRRRHLKELPSNWSGLNRASMPTCFARKSRDAHVCRSKLSSQDFGRPKLSRFNTTKLNRQEKILS
jgi:hypothetical protein